MLSKKKYVVSVVISLVSLGIISVKTAFCLEATPTGHSVGVLCTFELIHMNPNHSFFTN